MAEPLMNRRMLRQRLASAGGRGALVLGLLASLLSGAAAPASAATIFLTVTRTDDFSSGSGLSLRQAINALNGNTGCGFQSGSGPVCAIQFDLPRTQLTFQGRVLFMPPAPITITQALPVVQRPVVIDGATQPGFVVQPLVVVRGQSVVVSGQNRPPSFEGLVIAGGNSTIRGLEIDNFAQGLAVTSSGNAIVGSSIGTGAGNGEGIEVRSGNNTSIGGSSPADRNVISGNLHDGVILIGGAGARVVGNLIGIARDGTTAQANLASGVEIQTSGANNVVGGTDPGLANTIAFNTHAGVFVNTSGGGDAVRANSIFANGGSGIVSNGLQRAPSLTSATSTFIGTGSPLTGMTLTPVTNVQGTVSGTPNTTVTVDWFDNSSCDASGAGEGQSFVGSVPVAIGATGSTTVHATWFRSFTQVTVTATSAANNTSSFSNCQAV
jgi:hypothetical protein